MLVVVQVRGSSHECCRPLSRFISGNWGEMDGFQHRRQLLFDLVHQKGWKVSWRRLFHSLREKKYQNTCRVQGSSPSAANNIVFTGFHRCWPILHFTVYAEDCFHEGKPEVNVMLWCSAAYIKKDGKSFNSYDNMGFNDFIDSFVLFLFINYSAGKQHI